MGTARRAASALTTALILIAASAGEADAQQGGGGVPQPSSRVNLDNLDNYLLPIVFAVGGLLCVAIGIPMALSAMRRRHEEVATRFGVGLLPVIWIFGSTLVFGLALALATKATTGK